MRKLISVLIATTLCFSFNLYAPGKQGKNRAKGFGNALTVTVQPALKCPDGSEIAKLYISSAPVGKKSAVFIRANDGKSMIGKGKMDADDTSCTIYKHFGEKQEDGTWRRVKTSIATINSISINGKTKGSDIQAVLNEGITKIDTSKISINLTAATEAKTIPVADKESGRGKGSRKKGNEKA